MVVNIVDVGWATSKSGCLPISAVMLPTCNTTDYGHARYTVGGNLEEESGADSYVKKADLVLYEYMCEC
jgi:hypothetical protein